MINENINIELYKSLFKGRTDIYAIRWDKNGRSGYMPAYKVDWSEYNKHKAQGGTFKNYQKKEYTGFSELLIIDIEDKKEPGFLN